jgi:hypothetical protein
VDDDAARQLVAEVERVGRPASDELMHPIADAVHGRSEGVVQTPGVAVVVAVTQ